MAWWQRRPKADREKVGDAAHTPRMIQPGSIQLVGLELERAVQKEVLGDNVQWELQNMWTLFTYLEFRRFCIALSYLPDVHYASWCVAVSKAQIKADGDHVREFSEHSPAIALARAALAAVRQWPE